MAIETVNAAMSLQMQSSQRVSVPERVAPVTESVAAQATAIDATTPVVQSVSAQGDGDSSYQEQQNEQEKIKKAVEQMNKNMSHSEAVYGFHDKTNRVTIKIVDKDTKEIIKELPPEKTLDMIAKVWEMAGILVDEKR